LLLHANLLLIPANPRAKAQIAALNERGDGAGGTWVGNAEAVAVAVAVGKSPSHDMGNDAPASLKGLPRSLSKPCAANAAKMSPVHEAVAHH
jgi:hypothetical protein